MSLTNSPVIGIVLYQQEDMGLDPWSDTFLVTHPRKTEQDVVHPPSEPMED